MPSVIITRFKNFPRRKKLLQIF